MSNASNEYMTFIRFNFCIGTSSQRFRRARKYIFHMVMQKEFLMKSENHTIIFNYTLKIKLIRCICAIFNVFWTLIRRMSTRLYWQNKDIINIVFIEFVIFTRNSHFQINFTSRKIINDLSQFCAISVMGMIGNGWLVCISHEYSPLPFHFVNYLIKLY